MDVWRETRERDGRSWRIGRDPDVAWIMRDTFESRAITNAVPAQFEAYWTLGLPFGEDREWTMAEAGRFPGELVELLVEHTKAQPWWLGFLNRWVGSDVTFDDVEPVAIYNGGYVLVEAGSEQARDWRTPVEMRTSESLPDLMFPTDRDWLATWLWDDEWMSFGGPRTLQRAFADHSLFGSTVHAVNPADPDSRPPAYH